MAYKAIVVGTDGSETAERAVDVAIEQSKLNDARLIIVTAFERAHDAMREDVPDEMRWLITDATKAQENTHAARERAYAAGLTDVVVQAAEGLPAEELIEVADDFNAGLIVVGSVGLTDSALVRLGNVASAVLHHAPCDVIVVQTTS